MRKSTHTPAYDAFRARLVAMREAAGMNQRQMAKKLDVPRSFVSRTELGEGRVDILEFLWICQALGASPEKTTLAVIREFKRLE